MPDNAVVALLDVKQAILLKERSGWGRKWQKPITGLCYVNTILKR
jgi:hypothetical protein